MALTMAPATESVMGSLPLAKAGVGSAVNDTTRQVGGALGVAIIGSVLSSTYGSKVSDFFASRSKSVPASLKPQFASAQDAAHSSLGGAKAVADSLPHQKLPLPAALVEQLAATSTTWPTRRSSMRCMPECSSRRVPPSSGRSSPRSGSRRAPVPRTSRSRIGEYAEEHAGDHDLAPTSLADAPVEIR